MVQVGRLHSNGNLIFVYATDSYWGFTGRTLPNGESETRDTAVEHRVYLSQGNVIRHLFKEVSASSESSLSGLLKKAENRPCADQERALRLIRYGNGATGVKNSADLGACRS
jgi:hypothetical protein